MTAHTDQPCRGCGRKVTSTRVLRVRTARDLARLTRTWRRYDAVELVTERIDPGERVEWEQRLTDAYTECGCHAGGAALLVALVAVGVYAIAFAGDRSWETALIGFLVCVAAAIVGKLIGISLARWELRRDARRVAAILDPDISMSALDKGAQ